MRVSIPKVVYETIHEEDSASDCLFELESSQLEEETYSKSFLEKYYSSPHQIDLDFDQPLVVPAVLGGLLEQHSWSYLTTSKDFV